MYTHCETNLSMFLQMISANASHCTQELSTYQELLVYWTDELEPCIKLILFNGRLLVLAIWSVVLYMDLVFNLCWSAWVTPAGWTMLSKLQWVDRKQVRVHTLLLRPLFCLFVLLFCVLCVCVSVCLSDTTGLNLKDVWTHNMAQTWTISTSSLPGPGLRIYIYCEPCYY